MPTHHIAQGRGIAGQVLLVFLKLHMGVGYPLLDDIHPDLGNLNHILLPCPQSPSHLFIEDIVLSVFLIIISSYYHLNIGVVFVYHLDATDCNQHIFVIFIPLPLCVSFHTMGQQHIHQLVLC